MQWLPLLLACGAKAPPADGGEATAIPPVQVEPAASIDPTMEWIGRGGSAEGFAMYRAFSVRDPQPVCAEVEALAPVPTTGLLEVVQLGVMPPWAAMRAASCLVSGHADQVPDTLAAWVADPQAKGLALLVLDQIDDLPEPLALQIAAQALAGPHAAEAPARLSRSTRTAVAALAAGATP